MFKERLGIEEYELDVRSLEQPQPCENVYYAIGKWHLEYQSGINVHGDGKIPSLILLSEWSGYRIVRPSISGADNLVTKVAYFSLKIRDKQSANAILSGLCNPNILSCHSMWSTMNEKHKKELK
ncbi:hypothetical protein TNCT_202181 [Trichonephila clavata]|uniref:Uncharacterized protein n=1 Tax=Trichonephila clavata TaxID=2740835 RepID=A0A8X6J9K3_TRICU|nr:hypothetical protein TNCT_202181 [Trichonephila clavata]